MTAADVLWVAGRSEGADGGLYRVRRRPHGEAQVDQAGVMTGLSALCQHPRLPLVYGVAVRDAVNGRIVAWSVADDVREVFDLDCAGQEPCHVSIDATGSWLAVTTYSSGTVSVWRMAADGSVSAPTAVLQFSGSGPEDDRQSGAHPHQAVFDHEGVALTVVDLGSDRIWGVGVTDGAWSTDHEWALPAGSGPRHSARQGSRIVVSAELSSQVLSAAAPLPGEASWARVASTVRSGPAVTRSPRNYPGDIQVHPHEAIAYVANRGYDTIGVFDITDPVPELIAEVAAGVAWPQHLLVTDSELIVCGWDSSAVAAVPLQSGVPAGPPTMVAEVPGACWVVDGRR